METLGEQSFGWGIQSPGLVSAASPGDGCRAVRNGVARHSGADGDEIHPRLEAAMNAARFHGMELDPREFPRIRGEQMPSAAALSAWLQNAGMWAQAVRLRWRQLMRLQDAGPVVLLFNDGGAGLLVGVNAEHNVVILGILALPRASAALLWTSCGWSGSGQARRFCCAPRAVSRRPTDRSA